jgi:hypothetical protein
VHKPPLLENWKEHYEDIRPKFGKTLQADQTKEFWVDLIRDTIRLSKRTLKPICLLILLWGKRGLNKLYEAQKRFRKGGWTFTIRIKWCLLGLLLLIAFHPHSKIMADPVQPVKHEIPMAKKIPESKLKPQQEVAEIKTQTADASLSAIPSIVSNCGDNEYANFIYMHESGCSLTSVNSIGCVGIGQSCGGGLESACPNWQTDYVCQNSYFSQYANSRYGGWSGAYGFWVSAHWW